MGKFEKLVVLAVLFAAAIVLAISFNRGKEGEASGPLGGVLGGVHDAPDREAQGDAPNQAGLQGAGTEFPASDSSEGARGALPAAQPPSLLLHAGEETTVPDSEGIGAGLQSPGRSAESKLALEPESDPSQPILTDTNGLRPSFLDEFMMYTVAEGDTWSALAQRFYQDGRYTRNLHLANEDLSELTPGKEILVPVYDFIAADSRSGQDLAAAPASAQPSAGAASLTSAAPDAALPRSLSAAPGAAPAKSAKALEYEVRAGDTLSDISLAVFGTATRWNEILEANRELLKKPESLQVGMKLKIPPGGKLPVAAKPEAKKSVAKPKTAQAEKPAAASTKKKKVL